ncbi:MAG TPA: circularly permuted type 2 ATP-grasp protein, partial [Myxococcaceae bacterium]|nr:circularly permuted type 2 ATP-grasp protein [Myxococcaceae bacterium]
MSVIASQHSMLSDYRALPGAYDELLGATGKLRATVEAMLAGGSAEDFARTQALAEASLLNQGVTFSVYSDSRGVEKIFPVCLLPRVISASEWAR